MERNADKNKNITESKSKARILTFLLQSDTNVLSLNLNLYSDKYVLHIHSLQRSISACNENPITIYAIRSNGLTN